MDATTAICQLGITLIEDCAHTMGASWQDPVGQFRPRRLLLDPDLQAHEFGRGRVSDHRRPEIAARAIILSGSYMLYERRRGSPQAVFETIRLETPNCSARLDNLRAAILRAQLGQLDENCGRWNARYQALEAGLRGVAGVRVVERPQHEAYVGSSFQFHADVADIPGFVSACGRRGVELKWFGAADPVAFTSRYDSWRYFGDVPHPRHSMPATTVDLRVPLTFSVEDCAEIAGIIAEEAASAPDLEAFRGL